MLGATRRYFSDRGVLEVETPQLSSAATTDPAIESFQIRDDGPGVRPGRVRYLHTSPEFPMKRLLAAGSGDIYQICKVFRNGERGRFHNPEFTLLEWYRVGFDYRRLMLEVAELVTLLLPAGLLAGPPVTFSWQQLFRDRLDLDPLTATVAELDECAQRQGLNVSAAVQGQDADAWLDLLMTQCIEPNLPRDRVVFVHLYPASRAGLAQLEPDNPLLVRRFELYINGIELANGFQELVDSAEQRHRFEQEVRLRRLRHQPAVAVDQRLLAALSAGMPACSGVALGLDRLLMLAIGADSIDQVMAFSHDRA